VTPGDASVTLDIDGLPVQLVLPERDVDSNDVDVSGESHPPGGARR